MGFYMGQISYFGEKMKITTLGIIANIKKQVARAQK